MLQTLVSQYTLSSDLLTEASVYMLVCLVAAPQWPVSDVGFRQLCSGGARDTHASLGTGQQREFMRTVLKFRTPQQGHSTAHAPAVCACAPRHLVCASALVRCFALLVARVCVCVCVCPVCRVGSVPSSSPSLSQWPLSPPSCSVATHSRTCRTQPRQQT